MPNIFPAQRKITPSFSEPDLIVTQAQPSGAFALLPEGHPRVKIGSEDLMVYVNQLDLRTEAVAAQSPGNLLPSASLAASYMGTPTYLVRVRSVWDHHDMARAAGYAVALPVAQDLAMKQGIWMQERSALLYGYKPGSGEGIVNTSDATVTTLPPDQYGNTTVSTYDNGAMAAFWLTEIANLITRMWQSGGNIKTRIVVVSPQRVWLQFNYKIVQVTSYQRPGAGTSTIAQVVQDVAKESGNEFVWFFDDTLIGKGSGGSDLVILTMPEIELPTIPGIDTNVFGAEMQPQMKAINLQYMDMAAPVKIPTPTPDGAITEIQEQRITSGWCIRPSGLTLVSMPN